MFIGVHAIGSDRYSLEIAKAMIKSGRSEDRVLKETGWHLGMDMKWKFEISDQHSALTDDFIHLNLRNKLEELPLTDALVHPELFDRYPDLRRAVIRINPEIGARGHIYPGFDGYLIEVGAPSLTRENKPAIDHLSIMLHEIQHIIQKIEGFASGGNFDQGDGINHKRAISARLQDYAQTILEIQQSGQYQSEEQAYIQAGLTAFALETRNQSPSHKRKHALAQKLKDELDFWGIPLNSSTIKQIATNGFNSFPPDFNYKCYLRIGGEIEARNTAYRRDMTPESRRNRHPKTTQDMRAEHAIIYFTKEESHNINSEYSTDTQQIKF